MHSSSQHKSNNSSQYHWSVILLFLVWIVVSVFIILSQRAFQVSEAREGVVIQEILNYDTWVLPLRHGEVIPSKPPLFHWVGAILSKLLGGALSDFSLRLPSLLGGFIMAFVSFLFTKRHLGTATAQLTLCFFFSSYCFLQMSMDGRVDMLFCSILHCALFYFLHIFSETTKLKPSKIDLLIVGTLLGLSVLAKGPLGPVLFVVASAPLLIYKYGYKTLSFKFLKDWYLNIGLIPILLIPSPWYYSAYSSGNSGFVSRQLIFENVSRFIGTKGIPAKPLWFYIPHLFTQTPISLIFILVVGIISYSKSKGHTSQLSNRTMWIKTLLIQAFSLLIFLSLSSGKRRAYLLPIVPHLAIIAGILAHQLSNEYQHISLKYWDKVARLLIGASIVLHIFKIFLPYFAPYKSPFLIGLNDLPITTSIGLIILLLILLLLSNWIKTFSKNHNTRLSIYFTSWFLIVFLTLPIQFFFAKGYSHSYLQFAKLLKEKDLGQEKIIFIKKRSDESFDTLFYYYGKRINIHSLKAPTKAGEYLSRIEWLEAQSEEFQSNCKTVLIGGREKDPHKKNLILFSYTPTAYHEYLGVPPDSTH